MISSGIKLSQNRFAVLSRNPDSDEKQAKKNKARNNESNTPNQSQPKNNKKGNQQNKNSTAKQPQKQKKKDHSKHQQGSKNRATSSQIGNGDWATKDKALVEKLFHDDMSEALELSKQEFEKQKQTKKDHKSAAKPKVLTISDPVQKKDGDHELHKEKKPKSAKTISLKEFHQHVEKSLPLKNGNAVKSPQPETSKGKQISEVNGAGDYFTNIDKEVTQIERKERKKRTPPEMKASALSLANVFENERASEKQSAKNKEIEKVEEELQSWKDKFHHVKKRNQQLLVMLQQGEMKEKSELLLEVERLSVIRDELTENVTELHESLEKERSKVSKLKDELQAASRHKK